MHEIFLLALCVHMHVFLCTFTCIMCIWAHMWKSNDSLVASVRSLYIYVGSRDKTEVTRMIVSSTCWATSPSPACWVHLNVHQKNGTNYFSHLIKHQIKTYQPCLTGIIVYKSLQLLKSSLFLFSIFHLKAFLLEL